MSNIAGSPIDFETFLRDRGLTPTDFADLSREKQQYLQETWLLEQHGTPGDAIRATLEEPSPVPSPYLPRPASGDQAILWVFLGCIVVLVLCLLVPGHFWTPVTAVIPTNQADSPIQGARDIVQDNGRSPGQAVVASPLSSTTASDWREVGRAQGTGVKRLPSFTITGPKWRILWTTRPGQGQKTDDFVIGYRRKQGEPAVPAAHVRGESEGETVLRGTGPIYLEAASRQNYYVKVYDYR